MGLRFRKSVRICKGVRVNFSTRGASVSFGTRGLRYNVHTSGRRTTSVGIPGTGISYVSSTGGKRRKAKRKNTGSRNASAARARAQQQAAIQKQKDAEYAKNCQIVDEYNEYVDLIRSIHEECSDPVDWNMLMNEPAPYDNRFIGPNEEQARQALAKANDKPSFLGRLVPSAEKKRIQSLEAAVDEARENDLQLYSDWENLRRLAEQVVNGDVESYFYVVAEMHPFDEILDYGSDFDIGTDLPDIMEVEFHAKTDKVVPNHVLSMTQAGKLSSKQMTKTMHYDIVQDYICSCTLRIAREMFALLPIERVVIHAVDVCEDSHGIVSDETVLSVLIHRSQMETIDFDVIDASDTIETFTYNMKFKKTQGLKPVSRIDF